MGVPEEAYNRLVRIGNEWAECDAAADLLEETRKSVRAQLAMKHLPEAKSIGKAELMAEADPAYLEHVEKMVEARKTANLSKVNYDAARTWIDLDRSRQATEREQLKRL